MEERDRSHSGGHGGFVGGRMPEAAFIYRPNKRPLKRHDEMNFMRTDVGTLLG